MLAVMQALERPMNTREKENAAIVRARLLMAMVDQRARKCPSPLCRRNRRCMVCPSVESNFRHRTGGCPMTKRAEWAEIKPGLQASVGRVLDAIEAVMRVSGETYQTVVQRLTVCDPRRAPERRVLMDLWRR
jgi:hypothetical protein